MKYIKLEKLFHNTFFLLAFFVLIMAIDVVYQEYGSDKISSCISSVSTDNSDTSDNADTSKTSSQDETAAPKRIALTFDDGPHPKYTPKLLDGLKERNVKATFFVIGQSAANYPDILKRITEEGHLLGNHTYSHVQLSCIPVNTAISEINQTNDVIVNATGVFPSYIRPPYGSMPKSLKSETDLIPVLWTVDPRDWSVLNTDSVVKHVVKNAKDGDIILLHDIFETSVDAALIIIDELSKEGFVFVTVDELVQ